VQLKIIAPKRSWFGLPRLSFMAGWSDELAATLDDRAAWARLGL